MTKSPERALHDVREQLQTAIELEHSTIPPYLYAYWSMKDPSSSICKAIYDVIKEEMLHMGLACNVLNALGGSPQIATEKFIPEYPTALPAHDQTHDPFIVRLQRLNVEAVVTFMHIELPRSLGLEPDEDPEVDTIGEYYGNIIDNLKLLDDTYFKHGSQITQDGAPYRQGVMFRVDSRESALRAIQEIIEQGEGLSVGSRHHLGGETHFHCFCDVYADMGGYGEIKPHAFNAQELIQSIDPVKYAEFEKGVKPIVGDPAQNNSSRKDAFVTDRRFNSEYSHMLDLMHEAMTSDTPDMTKSIQAMLKLTRPALQIMSVPVDPDDISKGYCGPTFKYIPRHERI